MSITTGARQDPRAVAEITPATGRGRTAKLRAWLRPLYWPCVLGLVAWNAWWAWESRPLTDLRTVSAWIEADRLDEAETALRDWARRIPDAPDARFTYARLLALRDDLVGCAGQLRAVPFWSPLKTEALFREAQTWQKVSRARDAEAAFEAYLRADPNHPVAKPHRDVAEVELINHLTLEDRWDEARARVWRAFPRANDEHQREELLVMSLRTILERYAPDASVTPLRKFVAADPGDFQARLALAAALQDVGRPAEADEQVAACLKLRPEDPRLWRTRLGILKARGDLDAMREALKQVPPSARNSLAAYRGEVLAHDGDMPGAFAAFETALAAEPDVPDLQYRYAVVARRLGKSAEEQAALRRHARLRKAREALPEALTAFDKKGRAADAAPATRVTLASNLATLCQDLGLADDAREWAALARRSDPPNPGASPP